MSEHPLTHRDGCDALIGGECRCIPAGYVAVVDPTPVPLHGPLTCDQHGPTVTVTWRSGDRCPLCASYENERRLRTAMEEWAEGDCAYGDNCPSFGSRHGRCTPCVARKALEEDHA